ncbi:hypothetical protein STEG23_003127 [Scotinomys teguina]
MQSQPQISAAPRLIREVSLRSRWWLMQKLSQTAENCGFIANLLCELGMEKYEAEHSWILALIEPGGRMNDLDNASSSAPSPPGLPMEPPPPVSWIVTIYLDGVVDPVTVLSLWLVVL